MCIRDRVIEPWWYGNLSDTCESYISCVILKTSIISPCNLLYFNVPSISVFYRRSFSCRTNLGYTPCLSTCVDKKSTDPDQKKSPHWVHPSLIYSQMPQVKGITKVWGHYFLQTASILRWRGGTTSRALDLQSTGRGFKSYSGQKLRNSLWQVVHTYVPMSPSSITWYRPRGGNALRLERTM